MTSAHRSLGCGLCLGLVLLFAGAGCGDDGSPGDAGASDARAVDTGAPPGDSGPGDASTPDAGPVDASPADDAGPTPDAGGAPDAGPGDASTPDAVAVPCTMDAECGGSHCEMMGMDCIHTYGACVDGTCMVVTRTVTGTCTPEGSCRIPL